MNVGCLLGPSLCRSQLDEQLERAQHLQRVTRDQEKAAQKGSKSGMDHEDDDDADSGVAIIADSEGLSASAQHQVEVSAPVDVHIKVEVSAPVDPYNQKVEVSAPVVAHQQKVEVPTLVDAHQQKVEVPSFGDSHEKNEAKSTIHGDSSTQVEGARANNVHDELVCTVRLLACHALFSRGGKR